MGKCVCLFSGKFIRLDRTSGHLSLCFAVPGRVRRGLQLNAFRHFSSPFNLSCPKSPIIMNPVLNMCVRRRHDARKSFVCPFSPSRNEHRVIRRRTMKSSNMKHYALPSARCSRMRTPVQNNYSKRSCIRLFLCLTLTYRLQRGDDQAILRFLRLLS